jgi:hypothetical protein
MDKSPHKPWHRRLGILTIERRDAAGAGLDRNPGQRRASSGLPALTGSGQDGLTTHPASPSGRNLDRGPGATADPAAVDGLPDGLENPAAHNLVSYIAVGRDNRT